MEKEPESLDARLAQLRRDYQQSPLRRQDLLSDPFAQLAAWLEAAMAAALPEPTAMTLATVAPDGTPQARIVLLKGLTPQGLTFFTHYDSAKGRELAAHPQAAVCLAWLELHRQVRAVGAVTRVSPEESTAYFATRPRDSQLGAWCSPQSQVIASREALEARLAEVTARFHERDVPLPPFWGGFCLKPRQFEFWQGRPNRLHDRFRYTATDRDWNLERLAP